MLRSRLNIITFILFFCAVIMSCTAQVKSTDMRTIDGKKYYIHKIEKKQSLYAISRMYNVSIEELYLLNPELKEGAKAGQEIRIPFSATQTVQTATASANSNIDTSKYFVHLVAKGETVYSLTRKYNLTEKQLLAFNPALSEGLKEGQQVIVGEKKFRKKPTANDAAKKVAIADDTANEQNQVSIFVDSSVFEPVFKPKKSTYRIALMLPFKLNEILETDVTELARSQSGFPMVPALALDFYLGFKLAVDSMSAKDFSVTLEPYDVDETDSSTLSRITSSPRFDDIDFIFGPLYANRFKVVAGKARDHHIPVVSPITQQNKILFNNIYISKTNPSHFTLIECLADYIIDSLIPKGANIILMSPAERDRRETAYFTAFRKYFGDKRLSVGFPVKDTLKIAKGIEGVKSAYVPDVKNVVISLSKNQVFAADFSTQLALFANERDITLCGWQDIGEMDNIDQEYLNMLNYTFPHQNNLAGISAYRPMIERYKSRHGTFPGEYFFLGIDIGIYYLTHLKNEGPGFIYHLDTLPMETSYMRFKFARPDVSTGFDNRGVYIFRYDNYKLLKTGWK